VRRSRLVVALDVLIAVLAVGGIIVWLTGGFYGHVLGTRVSVRNPDRSFILALALAAARWWWARSHPGAGFLGQPAARYRRLRDRAFQARADDAPAAPGSRLSWQFLAAAGGLLLAVALLLPAQWRHMDRVPDLGDPLFSMWRMGWVHLQLGGDPRPLFDANIFHPDTLTLTLSDSMLLPSAAASPMLSWGVAPVVAYNLLFLSGFFLSGLTAYLLVRRLTGSARAAFIGGLLYAFYPYRYEHYSHLELQMTQWMPLALLCLHRFLESFRLRDMLLAALCVVAQLYSSMYYGVFFVFYAAAALAALLAVSRPPWRRVLGPAAVAGVLAIALAVPLARPYVAAQAMKGERQPWVVDYYSADLSDYLRPHPRLALYGGRLLPDIHPERALFPGASPLVLSAVGLALPLGPVRLAYAASLLVGFDLSRGMHGLLYRHFYDWFPPLRGMRVPSRFSVILGISLVVLGAYGARRLLDRVRSRVAGHAVFAALVAAVLFDLHPSLDLMPIWPEPPPIYQTLAGRTDVVLAEFPFEFDLPRGTNELPFMYFSIWHGLPMVNGYSGFIPESHEALVAAERAFPDEAALAALRVRGVTHVTANCALMPDRCDAFLEKADASPALRLVASDTWQGLPVRLYELLGPAGASRY
jgi:hypothetical protein